MRARCRVAGVLTPACALAALGDGGARCAIVLEDLRAAGRAPGDTHAPLTVAAALSAAAVLGRVHGALRGERALAGVTDAAGYTAMLGGGGAARFHAAFNRVWEGVVTAEEATVVTACVDGVEGWRAALGEGTQHLVHGDYKGTNLMYSTSDATAAPAVLDWQSYYAGGPQVRVRACVCVRACAG